jgi:hypothetical protein
MTLLIRVGKISFCKTNKIFINKKMKIKEPQIIKNFLDQNLYEKLVQSVSNPKRFEYQRAFSRYIIDDLKLPFLQELSKQLVPIARKSFESERLLPTYTLFAHYEGTNPIPSLYKHKDDNACTYTLDMCVYQNEPWDLWVENKAYTLYPNDALAYYGNDQQHWREKFPNPNSNYVGMIFFHFAEPEHWWFQKGRSYLNVIRKQISEEEWMKNLKI